MRTIAIINQKGGCGKTTVSINLASVLANRDLRTLLVDMDPQSHCALGLAVPESQVDCSVGDILRAGLDGTVAFSDVVWQISRNLDLVPSTMALAGVEQELSTAPDKDRRLAQVLANVADHYDFCVIDCPPSIGLLTFNALRAADEVIIPVETGYFSLQGAIRQEATIAMLARRVNHRARFSVLATMYDVRTKLAREILAELRRHFADKLLPIVIHFNSKLKEAASFGQPITEYDPASRGYQDFDKLVSWLMANPPQPADANQAQATSTNQNGAVSRAAELVERARALQARTAALASKLSTDSDLARERRTLPTTAPARAEAPPLANPPTPLETTPTAQAAAPAPASAATAVAEPTPAPAAPPQDLATKLAKLYGVRPTSQGLLFVQPANGATQLAIAGDFNNWSPAATPLQRDERLDVWQACVQVPPGRYRYRLVIDGHWTHDPYNRYVESNPFGELNNIVEVIDR